jgi:hypothetical protein
MNNAIRKEDRRAVEASSSVAGQIQRGTICTKLFREKTD